MTRTIAIAFAVAALAGLAAAIPAQAATRSVEIGVSNFAERCIAQGGIFSDANPTFACETGKTAVVCGFVNPGLAHCEWAGIDNQIAVNRLIGMAEAQSLATIGGTGKPGWQKPDWQKFDWINAP